MRRVVKVSQVELAGLIVSGVVLGAAVGLVVGLSLAGRMVTDQPMKKPAVVRVATTHAATHRLSMRRADAEGLAEVQPVGDLPPVVIIPESDDMLDLFDADGQMLLQVAPEDGDYYAILSDLMLQASDETDAPDSLDDDGPDQFIQRAAARPAARPHLRLHPAPPRRPVRR